MSGRELSCELTSSISLFVYPPHSYARSFSFSPCITAPPWGPLLRPAAWAGVAHPPGKFMSSIYPAQYNLPPWRCSVISLFYSVQSTPYLTISSSTSFSIQSCLTPFLILLFYFMTGLKTYYLLSSFQYLDISSLYQNTKNIHSLRPRYNWVITYEILQLIPGTNDVIHRMWKLDPQFICIKT